MKTFFKAVKDLDYPAMTVLVLVLACIITRIITLDIKHMRNVRRLLDQQQQIIDMLKERR